MRCLVVAETNSHSPRRPHRWASMLNGRARRWRAMLPLEAGGIGRRASTALWQRKNRPADNVLFRDIRYTSSWQASSASPYLPYADRGQRFTHLGARPDRVFTLP